MTNKEILLKKIQECFSDYGSDFSVTINDDGEEYNGWEYFDIEVTHHSYGGVYDFRARINNQGDDCEMDYHEDSWQPITMGDLFCYMWFQEAEPRTK